MIIESPTSTVRRCGLSWLKLFTAENEKKNMSLLTYKSLWYADRQCSPLTITLPSPDKWNGKWICEWTLELWFRFEHEEKCRRLIVFIIDTPRHRVTFGDLSAIFLDWNTCDHNSLPLDSQHKCTPRWIADSRFPIKLRREIGSLFRVIIQAHSEPTSRIWIIFG